MLGSSLTPFCKASSAACFSLYFSRVKTFCGREKAAVFTASSLLVPPAALCLGFTRVKSEWAGWENWSYPQAFDWSFSGWYEANGVVMVFRLGISVESDAEGKKELVTPGRLSKDVPWKAVSPVEPSVFGFLAA